MDSSLRHNLLKTLEEVPPAVGPGDFATVIVRVLSGHPTVWTPPHLLDSGLARLSSPLSHAIGSSLSMILIHALGCEVAELMGNASQQRLEIPEHTGRQVNAPGQQAGEGKFRLVRMKGLANFQEFLVFENDNGQPLIGVWGVTKIVVWSVEDAGEKPFLLLSCAYDDGVSTPQSARQETADGQTLHTYPKH
jgi:hypothetical protein